MNHPFERTLGLGPYRFVEFFHLVLPNEANQGRNNFASAPEVERGIGSCAHCNTPIVNIFVIQTGDGKRYGVGSDCIEKVGLPHRELTKVQKIERKHAKDLRNARKHRKGDAARSEIRQLIGLHKELLTNAYYNGRTWINYLEWCLVHSNSGGIVIVLAKLKLFVEEAIEGKD